MKIYTKIVLDKDNNIIKEQSYDYTGPVAYCGGGGEDGSAGSSSQEAANFDDYDTSTDLVDPSVSTDEFGTSPSNNTSTTSTTSSTSDMTGDPAQFTGGVDTVTDFSQFDNDNNDNNNEDIDSQYVTGKEFNVTPENKPGLLDYTKDEFRNQGLFSKGKTAYGLYTDPVTTSIGLLYSGYRAKKAAEKKAEPTLPTGEDGIGEGDYKSTVADWAESRGLTKDYSAEDNERQQEIDKAAFDAGFRTQDAKTMNINNDGDNNNPPTIINDNETYASVISPFRVVNTQGTGLPDPSNFLYTYVGSKQNILDLYNNVQNVLYKPQTNNGLLAVSDSPYYDFLKTRNLDRRIL